MRCDQLVAWSERGQILIPKSLESHITRDFEGGCCSCTGKWSQWSPTARSWNWRSKSLRTSTTTRSIWPRNICSCLLERFASSTFSCASVMIIFCYTNTSVRASTLVQSKNYGFIAIPSPPILILTWHYHPIIKRALSQTCWDIGKSFRRIWRLGGTDASSMKTRERGFSNQLHFCS